MKPTILVVEDDESVAYMLERLFVNSGFGVTIAADGESGWQQFQSSPPDVVVSDIKMPGMGGVELLARIKQVDPQMDVVLLTGHGDLSTAIQAIELGAYRYIEKPIHQISDLTQTIHKALERRKLVRDRQLIDRISHDLSRRLGLDDFLNQFLAHILAGFPQLNAAIISLAMPGSTHLTVVNARGFPNDDQWLGLEAHPGWSVGAQALQLARPVLLRVSELASNLEVTYQEPKLPPMLAEFARQFPQSGVLGIPIVSEDVSIGSLAVVNFVEPEVLDDHLVDLLTTLCSQVGLYLRNAQLYEERQAQTSRLRAVLNSAADGIIVIDPDGQVIMANPRYHAMFSSKGDLDLTVQRRLVTLMQLCLETQDRASFIFTLEHPTSDTPTILEVHAARVQQDGALMGTVASLRDVTLLRSLDQRRSDLLQLAKHEIGTPLAAISAWVHNLLQQERLPSKERAAILQRIVRQAGEVEQLVEETLSYSHLKEALLANEPTRVDISEMVEELAEETVALAHKDALHFSVEIEPDLWVQANYFALKRALRNLVENGRKYTPAGGHIALRAWRNGPNVQIEVEDTGLGINADELDQIFRPYYRGSAADSSEGSGLGLSIVRDVVTAHRGRIEVESQPGKGSRFTVTLLATRPAS